MSLTQRRELVTSIPGPQSDHLHRRRSTEVAAGFGVTVPVFVESADGAILRDVDGNQLIDLASGIAVTSVGASHPRVAAAISAQAARFTHTCFMVSEYAGFVELAERLNQITPGDHDKRTALFSTGAEAVENAVKLARTATGRHAVVVLEHAYHGRTLMTMSMTSKNTPYKQGFGPFAPEVYRVPMAYPYRWPGGADRCGEEALSQCITQISTQIGAQNVAAIVAEPIQGEGGFIVPPPGFLAGLAAYARENGIVFVADEIQTGLGRTGDMFASEHERLVPDLICTAKALAGGMPLSAVTGRAEIMDSVSPGGLGGTYAGNPVACAAALAALDVIETDGLVERARTIGNILSSRLTAVRERSPLVGDLRGRGAMMAVEIVHPESTTPAPELAQQVAAACHRQGVVVLVCGTFGNVLRLLPPLVIDDNLLEDAVGVLGTAVDEVSP